MERHRDRLEKCRNVALGQDSREALGNWGRAGEQIVCEDGLTWEKGALEGLAELKIV